MADVVTYAQNREDLYIASFFPDVEAGFYMDVGAHHPVQDSVTKYFSVHGWTGINIEPQRRYYEMLVSDRPKDINLNIGISDVAGTLRLREFPGDGLSTFSEIMKSEYEQDERMRSAGHIDYDVAVKTLADVFAEHVPEGQTVHFLKIDVEGLEYQVFQGNDWSQYRPVLLCVEANHIVQDWHQLLADAKYEKVFFDGLNEYFIAKEHIGRVERFAYARLFLADRQISPFYLSSRIEELNARIEHLLVEAAAARTRHAEELAKQADELRDEALGAQLDEANRQLQYWRSAAIRSWGTAMVGRGGIAAVRKKAYLVLRGMIPPRAMPVLRKGRNAPRALARRARNSRVAVTLRKVRNARRARARRTL